MHKIYTCRRKATPIDPAAKAQQSARHPNTRICAFCVDDADRAPLAFAESAPLCGECVHTKRASLRASPPPFRLPMPLVNSLIVDAILACKCCHDSDTCMRSVRCVLIDMLRSRSIRRKEVHVHRGSCNPEYQQVAICANVNISPERCILCQTVLHSQLARVATALSGRTTNTMLTHSHAKLHF